MNTTTNDTASIEILGQPLASAQASALAAEIIRNNESGAPHHPVLFRGPAGVGKSFSMEIMAKKISAITDHNIINLKSSGAATRLIADFKNLINTIESGGRNIIIFDECHSAFGRGNQLGASCRAAWAKFLHPLGQGTPAFADWRGISEDNGLVSMRDNIFLFGTSKYELLETAADEKKGERTNSRRFRNVRLYDYAPEDMPAVISAFLKYHNLRAAECSQKIIANFHRHTLEALTAVIASWKTLFPENNLISREKIMEAAKLTEFLPLGYLSEEGKVLRLVKENSGEISKSDLQKISGVAPEAFALGLARFSTQKAQGKLCPFLIQTGKKIKITNAGEAYLKKIQSEGFKF